MQKKPSITLPVLKGRQLSSGPRLGGLPAGSFVVKVERAYPFQARSGTLSAKVEVTVVTIESQQPYTNPETKLSNEVKVGDRRVEWFEFGGEYGYGEAEWMQFLFATGATEDTADEAQEAVLSAANPLLGHELRIRRTIQLAKNGKVFVKPYYEALA